MKSKMRKIRRYWPLYLMMLPACVYIFINNYVPLPGVSLAFRQYNFQKGIYGSPFIGLKNFKFLFASKDAWIIMRNTIGYNLRNCVCNCGSNPSLRNKIKDFKKNISDLYSDSVSGFDGNCQLSGICIPQ